MSDFNFGSYGDNSNSTGSQPSLGNLLPPEASNLNARAQAFLNGNQPVDPFAGLPTLPWVARPSNSLWFHYVDLVPGRWDQLYPYRLIVIDTAANNAIVNGSSDDLDVVGSTGTGSAFISIQPMSPSWIIQLPITPQQLSITDQFAINTSATLRGIMEEHNGVRFKIINASGSFGVWAGRPSGDSAPQTSPGILQSVFAGTLSAFSNLKDQVNSTINTFQTGHPANAPATKRPENFQGAAGFQSTGYYRAIAVQQFLEQYAEAKRNPRNATWRLVLDMPKTNQSFVVTPMQFTWQQNVTKPMEIMYNMQFKAWRRVNLDEDVTLNTPNNQPIDAGILQRILNTISQARNATSSALNLIAAVRSDLETPLNVLRQTSLFVKGLAGVATSAADLPFQLQSEYASSIKQSLNILNDSISQTVTDTKTLASLAAIKASAAPAEGLSLDSVANGQLGQSAQQLQSIDPSNNVFAKPEANFTLMDQVPTSAMVLTPAQQSVVDEAIAESQSLTVDDLKQFRAVIQTLAVQLSNSFGTGSAFYNQVYGLPPPTPRIQPITLDEYDLLQSLYDTMQSYDILTASNTIDSNETLSNMEYVAGLAADSDIAFSVPSAKVLAPVPFGLTIEGISLRYLGDAQRWLEIATLNNLRDPYIDENGFQLPLLSNATGRQVTIADASDLFLSQTIIMMSSTQTPSPRTILGIDMLSSTSFLITLDGLANLDNFVTADKAYMQAYLPGTVNSQQKIFIPSDLPAPNANDNGQIIQPSSTTGDPLTGLSKVDLMLTDTGDLAVNNFGDFRFSFGITNIIQALKIKMATSVGTVLTHPEFGLGLKAGISSADLDAKSLFKNINSLIQQDTRFAGLSSLQIFVNGPQLTISMGVQLAGKRGVYPVNFQLT